MKKQITIAENKKPKKKLKRLLTVMTSVFMLLASSSIVYADAGEAPYYGFGTTNGRTDTVNVNDYHTNSWERFDFNYQLESGANYRYDFGSPTTFNGQVQMDVYSANIRHDKNVSDVPPSYGVFSGNVATQPTNYLFEQPVNPAYWTSYPQTDPNGIPVYDTLQMGVNASARGNSMNMYNVGATGALQSTSIGGQDVSFIGANNATGQYYQQNDEWVYQSGNGSGTVTTPVQGEFLPPTSIK